MDLGVIDSTTSSIGGVNGHKNEDFILNFHCEDRLRDNFKPYIERTNFVGEGQIVVVLDNGFIIAEHKENGRKTDPALIKEEGLIRFSDSLLGVGQAKQDVITSKGF